MYKSKYILIQAVIMLCSPLASFIMSIRFYKNEVSQAFFIIFAMYFGYYMGFVHDLMMHYQNFILCFDGTSWSDIVKDPRVYVLGSDYYHITLKYILSRFTLSRQVFGAVVSGVYATAFIFFFRQFKEFYMQRVPFYCTVILLCVVTVVEFYWYQGFRFWTGVYVFAGFYLKYVNTSKTRYAFCTAFCLFFHYTLITLIGALLLNRVLDFLGKYARLILLLISLYFRTLKLDFVPLLLKYLPGADALEISITDTRIRTNWLDRLEDCRQNGNIVYDNKLMFFATVGILLLLIMRMLGVSIDKKYRPLLCFALTLFTAANFGYVDLIFYSRFFEASILILFSYLYIVSVKNSPKLASKSYLIIILGCMTFLYGIASPMGQVREYIMQPELIFGNFFMNWDGNALHINYDW